MRKKLLVCMSFAAAGSVTTVVGLIAFARWAEKVCGDVIETEDGISIDRYGVQLPEDVEL